MRVPTRFAEGMRRGAKNDPAPAGEDYRPGKGGGSH